MNTFYREMYKLGRIVKKILFCKQKNRIPQKTKPSLPAKEKNASKKAHEADSTLKSSNANDTRKRKRNHQKENLVSCSDYIY